MARKSLTTNDILLPVLAAWAHDEISIGRARELLHMPDDRIRAEAECRVSNAMKLKECRDRIHNLIISAIAILDEKGRASGYDSRMLWEKDWDRLRSVLFEASEL